MERLVISCDTCVMVDTDACTDCVVSHICAPAELPSARGHALSRRCSRVVLEADEVRAVRLLADAGMVPTLRHREAR